MAVNRGRSYSSWREPVVLTRTEVIELVTRFVLDHEGVSVQEIADGLPGVHIRRIQDVVAVIVKRGVARCDRVRRVGNGTTRTKVLQVYVRRDAPPAPPFKLVSPPAIYGDGWKPAKWIHPIRARALGLTKPTTPSPAPLDPDFSNPMKGAA